MSVSIRDLSLGDIGLSPALAQLREAYFRAVPEICTERASLVTKFSAEAGLFERERISPLDKARLYCAVLEHRKPVVWHTSGHARGTDGLVRFEVEDTSPFAGSTSTRFKGVPLYPEFMALSLWPELRTISRRKSNPYWIDERDVETLNLDVFPRWMKANIAELARARGSDEDRRNMQFLEKFVFFLASKPNCISHTIPDFTRAVREGLRTIIDDARTRKDRARDDRKRDFLEAIAQALEGVVAYARNLADAAGRMAALETNPARKAQLASIERCYRRVPELPATTFREGLTTVWVCWTAVHLENPNVGLSLGRLDQVLYDLYRAGVESRTLTVDEAVQLVGHLWLKIGDHVPTVPSAGEQLFGGTGSNQAITIGGVDAQGRDAVNDLTYVMLRATELMKLRDPNLNARFHPEVHGREYLRRLCDTNLKTGATPALHNDRAVIRALTASGHTLAQARDYGVIGCVEPGSNGRFYGASGAILLNLPSVLELTLFNGRHRHFGMGQLVSVETGDPARFRSFDEFREAFRTQLLWVADRAVALNELFGRTHQQFYPTPLLSALFEGPMENASDLIHGGAVLNASGIAVIGFSDVADSLAVVETTFSDSPRKRFELTELVDAVCKNYQGYEWLLASLRDPQRTPRFGNDDARADANATWLVQTLHDAFAHRENYRGGAYRVGYWTMTNHAGFGRFIGATPNGRKAGENFASGLTPCSGVTPCLPAALRSIAQLPVERIGNGMAVNLKFTPDDGDREPMLQHFVAAVEAYFDADVASRPDAIGGMEIQFNVTSHAEFLDAVKDPVRHAQLLVRVSGYTAYFKDLTPQMQQEIIDRTEYRLSSGTAVAYPPIPLRAGATS